jgi:6-phosphogluconolactonase (cycloisomerase 2 family)
MNVRALLGSIVVLATMSLAGCGHYTCGTTFGNATCSSTGGGISQGGSGGATGDAYLFIADAGGIQGEVLNQAAGTIKLTPNFGTVPTSGTGNVPGAWMAIAAEKFMYAAYPSSGQIYGWAIDVNGTLGAVSGLPLTAVYLAGNNSAGSQAMITNPAGTLLFVLDQVDEQVNVYQIGSGGSLTAVGVPVTLPNGFEPVNLAIDGLGKYLYVSNISGGGTTEVAAYSIGSGTLTELAGSPFASTIAQMQGEASGKFMIGTSSNLSDPNLYVETIQATGLLTSVASSTVNSPAAIAVQPNQGGNLVYSFGFPNGIVIGQIEGYQLNLSTGALSAITGSPFSAIGTFGLFDQSGKYLFVVEDSGVPTTNLDAYNVSTSSDLATPLATVGWSSGAWAPTDVP